jgi:hypothetical protein
MKSSIVISKAVFQNKIYFNNKLDLFFGRNQQTAGFAASDFYGAVHCTLQKADKI